MRTFCVEEYRSDTGQVTYAVDMIDLERAKEVRDAWAAKPISPVHKYRVSEYEYWEADGQYEFIQDID